MRVSDNTSSGSVRESLGRTRGRMEKLQIQNSTQKKILTPSDDPAGNAKIMSIRTEGAVNSQFEVNGAIAKNRLTQTDAALNEIYDIFVRAKEIAINQSSAASANSDSRIGVAQEVGALYKQLVSIGNRRSGDQYLFAGFKTLTSPYSADGVYKGDEGEIPVEIQKDVYTVMNLPGTQVFDVKKMRKGEEGRGLASVDKTNPQTTTDPNAIPKVEKGAQPPVENINLFHELDALRTGLLTNDTVTIRDTLDNLDSIINHVITTRAKISSRVSGIDTAIGASQRTDVQNAELATQIEDADYAELWSSMAKEESVLRSSLQAAQKLIQPTLLEFIR